VPLEQGTELDIWRAATTIYMTSGHGGCHPVGLALAACERGFSAQVYVNTTAPLFVDGVRSEQKKRVMESVHQRFMERAGECGVDVVYGEVDLDRIEDWLRAGFGVLVLISTYRLDGRKSPHWVTVTGLDAQCLYVHDPDTSKEGQRALDCQHVPIAREDFARMASFGSARLRTAVAIKSQASH
jgi:hypothetical protein